MKIFCSYWFSLCASDRITQEYNVIQWLPVFYMLKKRNYTHMTLCCIEKEYGLITYQDLMSVRCNCSFRLKEDTDAMDVSYKDVALDEMVENCNHWTKCLPVRSDSKSWETHSPNVTYARRVSLHEHNEFRNNSKDLTDCTNVKIKENKKNDHGVTPKETSERCRLYEFVVKFCDQQDKNSFERIISDKDGSSVVDKLETKLHNLSVEEEIKIRKELENDILGRQIEDIFNNTDLSHEVDDDLDVLSSDNEEELDLDVGEQSDENGCNNENRLRQGKIHHLALIDVFEMGEQEMIRKKVRETRLKHKRRMDRHRKFQDFIYQEAIQTSTSLISEIRTIQKISKNCTKIWYHSVFDSLATQAFDTDFEIIVPYVESMINHATTKIWKKKTLSFQRIALLKLLNMHLFGVTKSCVLTVQSTGSGKSLIPMTFRVISRGVTLIIENTLSLASDQKSKFEHMNEHYGAVHAFQLDAVKSTGESACYVDF